MSGGCDREPGRMLGAMVKLSNRKRPSHMSCLPLTNISLFQFRKRTKEASLAICPSWDHELCTFESLPYDVLEPILDDVSLSGVHFSVPMP